MFGKKSDKFVDLYCLVAMHNNNCSTSEKTKANFIFYRFVVKFCYFCPPKIYWQKFCSKHKPTFL